MEPDDIEARAFTVALRGYDREEVDAFLRDVAREVRQLGATPDPRAAPAESSPGRGLRRADAYRQVGDETARILVAAEQSARDIKERARHEGAEILADAREEAAAVARRGLAARTAAEEEMRGLLKAREQLCAEMEDLRRRVEDLVLRMSQPFEPAVAESPVPEAGEPSEEQEPAELARLVEAGVPEPVPTGSPTARRASQVAGFFSGAWPPRTAPFTPGESTQAVAQGRDEAVAAAAPLREAEDAPGNVEESVVVIRTPLTSAPNGDAGTRAAGASGPAGGNGGPAPAPAAAWGAPKDARRVQDLPPPPTDPGEMAVWRASALGNLPVDAARRLKRLLQDDQSDLLERLRAWRGVGPAANHVPPPDRHADRFRAGLWTVLDAAFRAGRHAGGSAEPGDPSPVIGALVAKQLVTPLRRDLLRLIEPPPGWDPSATAATKRASDVYRVWKGVRTDLLGEGLVYAVFHQGVLDAARSNASATKEWILSADERNCPKDVCRSNASAGSVGLEASFGSGHLVPPAHGGCSCTLFVRG